MNWLDPFRHPFMLDALAAGCLAGAVCAALSCVLVLRGWSLMGDAISHAVFPGVVLAYVVGLPLVLGGFGTGLLCAVATGWIKANSRIKEDTVLGIVFTGLFAMGLVMFTWVESDVHLNHILFGHILGIEPAAFVQTAVAAAVTLAVVIVKRRDLLLYIFDAAHARAIGLPVTALHYLFLTLLSVTIVASIQSVGIILVVAMLVTPGCVGRLMSDRFDRILLVSIVSAVLAVVGGIYASYFIDCGTGPCIVLVAVCVFRRGLCFCTEAWMVGDPED